MENYFPWSAFRQRNLLDVLECVVNVSEGRNARVLARLTEAAGAGLLDVHVDPHHNRSVFTLAGSEVQEHARSLVSQAVNSLDLTIHEGVHPRIGTVDVVPFVPLPDTGSTMADALRARNDFAEWEGVALGVPCFFYGPERSLPEVRKTAFISLSPDTGPPDPHPRAGATAVGARDVLIAYNLWIGTGNLLTAREIARHLRSPAVRALGLDVGGQAQVSCNLVDPQEVGPGDVYEKVAAAAAIERAELVGLIPRFVLSKEDPESWEKLGIGEELTIEARLARAGLNRGKI